jgi:hypothetical protein
MFRVKGVTEKVTRQCNFMARCHLEFGCEFMLASNIAR